MVRSPHLAVCQPNQWCRDRTALFAPTERVVRSPNGLCSQCMGLFAHQTGGVRGCSHPNGRCGHCTRLFAHLTGGAVTAHGCLSTVLVVQSPYRTVCPPNECSHSTRLLAHDGRTVGAATKRGCSSTEQHIQRTWYCSHSERVVQHGCLLTERVVRSLCMYMDVCSPQTGGAG